MNEHPTDYLFWRSAMNAPLQFMKLPKWHIYIEKDSGVRFFHNKTGFDITEQLKDEGKITYFKNFDDLYRKAKRGICNGIFFKDLHKKNIKKDNGTLQWFKFIRYLLSKFDWCQVFLDEYQEMVKAYQSGELWKAIDSHGDDVTEGRKTRVGIHGNCHDIGYQLDHRVIPGFMIFIQLYGSSVIKNRPVNKRALSSIPEPNEKDGAVGWISEGNRYGRLRFEKVYKLSENQSISARIISSYEKTKVCPVCNHVFIPERMDQIYCTRACNQKARRERNKDAGRAPSHYTGQGTPIIT